MGALAEEYVRVRADTSYMGRDLKKQGAASGKTFGGAFGASLKGILGAAVVFKALSSATSFLKEANAEARESQKVGATTTQIIKSTGGAAKITAGQVGALATSISNKTGVDDEAVQSGSNLLLTFKNVRNETGKGAAIFDRATAAAVDLSAAGFGSVSSSSKMLGKALNDPLKGISALSRAGVTFTDQQKQQIKAMVESGDVLGAQKLIMKEVESQVGGVAAASATAGEKMKVAWDNSKEALGTALLPLVDEFAKVMTAHVIPLVSDFAGWLGERIPGAITKVKGAFDLVQESIDRFLDAFRTGKTEDEGTWLESIALAARDLWQIFQTKLLPILSDVAAFVRDVVLPAWADWYKFLFNQLWPIIKQLGQFFLDNVVPALSVVVDFIRDHVVPGFMSIVGTIKDLVRVVVPIITQIVGAIVGKFIEMKPQIMSIWTSVKEIIVGVMFIIKDVIQAVTAIIKMIWDRWGDQITAVVTTVFGGLVKIISGVMKAIAGVIKLAVALIKGDWSGAWNAIKQIFSGVWQAIKGILTVATAVLWQVLQAWWAKVKALWSSATTAVKTTWNTFWTNIKSAASTALEWVRSKVVTVLDKIKNAFSTAKTNIKKIWDGLKDVVSKPVEWIKTNVYNKPLVPVWNKVAGLVNGPKLSAYREGGEIRGPRHGRDNVLGISRSGGATAMVEPGEWIAPRWMSSLFPQLESIRKRGRAALQDVGDPKRLPGFQGGGLVGWAKGLASNVSSKVGSFKDWALGGLRAAAAKILDPVKGLIGKAMPNSGVGSTVGNIGKKLIDLILDKIKSSDAAAMPALGGPAGSAIASGGWASIYRVLRAAGARSFTTYAGHDQGASRSRDIWPPSQAVAEAARRLSSIWYVIYNRRIASVTYGMRWRPYTRSNPHTDHVHVTLKPGVKAALGGMAPMGAGLMNGGLIKGGRGGVLAHIGEGRRDELVTPLPRNWQRQAATTTTDSKRPITILIDLGEGLVQRVQGLIDENDEFRATVGRAR